MTETARAIEKFSSLSSFQRIYSSANACCLLTPSLDDITQRVQYSNYRGYRGALARSALAHQRRSDRNGGGRHATRRQQLSELSGFEHLADDVAAADELAFDVELRNRWPVRACLHPLAGRWIAEHLDTFELDAQVAQHLHHQVGKTALGEDRSAVHEQHDIVPADLALDALLYWILHSFDLLSGTVGVVVRAEEMQGNVGLVAGHPAVGSGCDVEDVSRAQFGDGAVVHRSGRAPRDDDADMLDRTTRRAGRRADMQ